MARFLLFFGASGHSGRATLEDTMRTLRAFAIAAAMLSLAACDDGFGPWGSEGYYFARQANGDRLPAVLYEESGPVPYSVSLTGGELRIRGDDTFRMEIDYHERDGTTNTYYTQGIAGNWTWDGDGIRLDYIDPATDNWRSLRANRRYDQMEVTIAGVAGQTVRVVFEK